MKIYCFLFCCALQLLKGDVPLAHNGHISVNGTPYSGNGSFKFSIVDQNESILWNHDESLTSEPTGAISLNVNNGFYSVFLGDLNISGMSALPASALRNTDKAYLKIWFDEGDGTFEQIGSSMALGASPFALISELSRGSPEIENRLTALENKLGDNLTTLENKITSLEQIVSNIPPSAIDPILLAEVGYTKFPNRELNGLSLPGVNFTKANFKEARITSANLISATMDEVKLSNATIRDSNLSDTTLKLSDLSRASLYNVNLNKTDASGSTFGRIDGNMTNLSQAKLDLSDFTRASFVDSNFTQSNFSGSTMGMASFIHCNFEDGTLTNLDAVEANFSDSNFTNAVVSGNLTKSRFQRCDFKNTNFSGSNFTDANLTDALHFDPSVHTGVIYSNTTLPDGTIRTD
ncbi:pentapeptide repeat-containing protein [Opitutales bacterium]|nr:pentapeptide repeat-containing protein [Opitutales bacterium]